jgi:hypothetical protein
MSKAHAYPVAITHLELFIPRPIRIYLACTPQLYLPAIPPQTSRSQHYHSQNSILSTPPRHLNNIRSRPLRIFRILRRSRRLCRSLGCASSGIGIVIPIRRCTNRKLLAIILRTSLSNRHQHRLVITRARHTADTIVSCWQSTCDRSTEQTIPIPSIVDALEEHERDWVRGRAGLQTVTKILDRDVCMADDLSVAGKVLGGRVVGGGGVGEGTRCQTFHLNRDGEGRAGSDVLGRFGGDDDGGDHVGC